MTIDKAIECLQMARKKGVKNIIIAFWEAEMFNKKDDGLWADTCDHLDYEMDWSNTWSDLDRTINEFEFLYDQPQD